MKNRKKVLLSILAIAIIVILIWVLSFICNEKKITKYSVYCGDEIRAQLGEYVGGVTMTNVELIDGAYRFTGRVSSETKNYTYSCSVKDKENVDLVLNEIFDVSTEEKRIAACEERAGYYLNFNEGTFEWGEESEAGASFMRYGHASYLKWGEYAEDDVACYVDMVDGSVTVEFDNHIYVGKLQDDKESIIDEQFLNMYEGFDGNIIEGDVLQSNYIKGPNTIYYDKTRGIAFRLGEEFDGGLIREIDTDIEGYPYSEIILLVKGNENEENRTGINGYREVYTIRAISKTNLENFGVAADFSSELLIGENNEYYFLGIKVDENNHYSDLKIFDVES